MTSLKSNKKFLNLFKCTICFCLDFLFDFISLEIIVDGLVAVVIVHWLRFVA